MRPRLLLVLAALLPAPPALAELASLDDCLAALQDDPAAAREAAARWRALGGGTPAQVCEAFALDALGAARTAAERLTDLAQAPGSGLSAPERAALFDRAAAIWERLGERRLSRLTRDAAARLEPGAARAAAAARAQAAEEDWAAVLDTLAPLTGTEADRPALRARALIGLGRLDAAAAVIAAAPPAPSLTLAQARLHAARGDRAAALATLATLDTAADPSLAAEARALLQELLSPAPAPPPPDAPRPMPRRP